MKVRIRCHETIHYDQTVEMTGEEFEEFKETVEDCEKQSHMYSVEDIWIDPYDIDSGEGPEYIEYKIVKDNQ